MMKTFATFRMPQTVLYGRESLAQIGKQASALGHKVLLISDRVMEDLGNVHKCRNYLEDYDCEVATYLDVNTEPTDTHVLEAVDVFQRERCDLIIALGGGSCIDTAKAVAVVAANGGNIRDYYGSQTLLHGDQTLLRQPSIPLIAVPTTAGTGSEMTDVTVITNTADDVKMMIKDPVFLPTIAIVDSLLTLSSPAHVTAATGVDALCHAIEAYISRVSQPLTDTLALEAIRLISDHIRRAYRQGDDVTARENMALAAMQAGAAFSNASVCLVHGMSRPLGAMFHVPHGVSNAMLLPSVMEFTQEASVQRLAVIGRIFDDTLANVADQEAAEGAVREMKRLCSDLNIPNMKTWGIDFGQFEQVVRKMAVDALASGSPGKNPRIPTEEEIVQLYYTCYDDQYEH